MNTNLQRVIVLSLLVLLMAATRTHVFTHFTPVPDASWAVFFIGGFYLRNWSRWAFPLLMVLAVGIDWAVIRSEEHTSELQSLMRISYAVFCLKKKNKKTHSSTHNTN